MPSRAPATGQRKACARWGCCGCFFSEQWRNVAAYVDRILKGANPADLPVERPSRYLLAINIGAAKAIGLAIPPAVMVRADEIVQ